MELQKLLVREPEPPPKAESPIADAPGPSYLGRKMLVPVNPMPAREKGGYVFWGILGAFILGTEAVAAFWSGFPIPTISGTVGHLEQNHDWVKVIVLGGITVLAFRIAFYPWPFHDVDD